MHPAAAPSSAAEEAAAVLDQRLPAADAAAHGAIAARLLLCFCLVAATAYEGSAPSLAAPLLHGRNKTSWGQPGGGNCSAPRSDTMLGT